MSGTRIGGIKASETNIKLHGKDFYRRIGAIGGSKSTTGGFASCKVGADGLTGPQRAKIVGGKGGLRSTRKGVKNGEGTWRLKKVIPWGKEKNEETV